MSQSQGISIPSHIPSLDRFSSGANLRSAEVEKTRDLAKQFESVLLTQLLKEMRQTLDKDTMFAGDSSDIQGGLFDFFMGNFVAESGGVGLAQMMIQQLQVTPQKNEAASHAATTHARIDVSG